MSYVDWYVGMEVVRVTADEWVSPEGCETCGYRDPEFNEICIIRKLVMLDDLYLAFEGFHPDDLYEAAAFRPVQKRKTDISIFTRLLTDPRVRIGEDA